MSNLVPKTRKYRRIKFLPSDFTRNESMLDGKYKFIWITDGYGWKGTTAIPLRQTFDQNDYLFTLNMLEKGIPEFLLDIEQLIT